MTHDTRPTVIVAETQEIVRETVARHIADNCGITVAAETDDGYSTIKACRQFQPDILLLDMAIAYPSGVETLSRLRSSLPDLKIIAVTEDTSVPNAIYALSKGVISVLTRKASADDYLNAVRAALKNHSYLPTDIISAFLDARRSLVRSGNMFGLSSREMEVLEACVSGASTREVAENLNISVRTVETHRHNIYRKTDCSSMQDLEKFVLDI
ncbi:LuxR C-terminal-related transcriptional regulator [Yoonia maritima]|uniref:LuxR C-terminal-related transcriptional regulator n=1 Tax=Yoonia maritima TaxID=1435347 RepID=UPI000D0E6B20|nr:response regulator transcription factor [Yoonia maritima]